MNHAILKFMSIVVGLIVSFSAIAKGAHDLWAATLVYLAVFLFVAALVLRSAFGKKPLYSGLSLPAFFILACFGLSTMGAFNKGESILELLDWAAALLLFFVSLCVFREEASLKRLLLIMTPVLWIEAIVSLSQTTLFPETIGTFVNSNVKVAFTLFWIPVFWDCAVKTRRWWAVSGLVAAGISFFTVASTWGLICLFVMIPFFINRPQRRTAFLMMFIATGFLLMGKYAFFGWSQLQLIDRLYWWKSGLLMWMDHPWLGVGLGNYPSAYLAYKAASVQNTLYPHNFLIGLLAETGSLGTAAFVLFSSQWHRQSSRRPYKIGLGAVFLFCLNGLGFEYLGVLLVGGLFAAIAMAPQATAWIPRPSVAIITAALLLAMVPFLAAQFRSSQLAVYAAEQLAAGHVEEAKKAAADAFELNPFSQEARAITSSLNSE